MSASTLTTVAHIYKRKYADNQVAEVAMRDHVTFTRIAKKGGFSGTAFYYPITYGFPQGISGDFATAQAAAASSKGLQLAASRKPKFAVITLDGEAMAASNNQGAFLDLVSMETEFKLKEFGDNLAFDLFREGYGQRGRRASAASNVITLTSAHDVRNFKVGMTVIADDTATGASPRTGSTTITAIDEDAGTITLSNAASLDSFADNDYLFRKGDPGTCMEGFESCTPLTAPTSGDTFRGLSAPGRSVDVRGLAGSRVDATSDLIEENFGLGAVKVHTRGKKLKEGCLHPVNFWTVAKRMQAKVEFSSAGGQADYGFESLMIHTPGGSLRIYSDPDCPVNRGRAWDPATHYIKHLEELPHIIRDDGRPSMREATADGIEIRARAWCNYIQTDPAAHLVISI
jgi:hypothetical protein